MSAYTYIACQQLPACACRPIDAETTVLLLDWPADGATDIGTAILYDVNIDPKLLSFVSLCYTLCPGNVPAIMHCYAPHCNMPPPCTVVHAIFPMLSVASCSHLGLLRKGKERVTLSALVSDCNVPDFFALSPGRCDDAWVFQWKMKKCVKNLTIQSDDI